MRDESCDTSQYGPFGCFDVNRSGIISEGRCIVANVRITWWYDKVVYDKIQLLANCDQSPELASVISSNNCVSTLGHYGMQEHINLAFSGN